MADIKTVFPNAGQFDELVGALKSVTIVGPQGPQGEPGADGKDGETGPAGKDGVTPTIGENGNWYLGEVDTGRPSRGPQGPQGNPGQDGAPGAEGAPGQTGAAAGFGVPTATVQNTTGTPSVKVDASGPDTAKIFAFTFSGIKGEPGEQGPEGPAYELTPEDKSSIVQDVLAALPNAEGVGF